MGRPILAEGDNGNTNRYRTDPVPFGTRPPGGLVLGNQKMRFIWRPALALRGFGAQSGGSGIRTQDPLRARQVL